MPQLLLRGGAIGDFKGVLFDKDGTLSNSEVYLIEIAQLRIKEALKFFRQNHLLDQSNKQKVNKLFNDAYGLTPSGLDPNGSIAIASKQDNLISTATLLCLLGKDWPNALEISQEIFSRAEEKMNAQHSKNIHNTLLPGVKELLDQLNAAKVECALISNDSADGIKHFLQNNNLEDKFVGYWSADDKPAKPSPIAVKDFCKLIKFDPAKCLFIGDSDSDLKMSREAGVGLTLGYTAGWTTMPKLTYQEGLIHSWNDLTCGDPKQIS